MAASAFHVLAEADFPEFASNSSQSGTLYLFNPSGVRLQQVTYRQITSDGTVSYGFHPDGDVTQFYGTDPAVQGYEELTPTSGSANDNS